MNPQDYTKWPYSSLDYYRGIKQASWVHTGPILDMFDRDLTAYQQFIKNYKQTRKELIELKWQLADGSYIV